MTAFSVVPAGMEAFDAANAVAGMGIATAGSADAAGMSSAVATAVGPIGVVYLAGFLPAMMSNLTSTLSVGAGHLAIGGATEVAKAAFIAVDSV
ncbi:MULTISPECIES: hypothetical protein [Mycolicibacterium]|uniref:hypothetical protein n=1 Tax=Mycolicibacterium TaxID=1866885 RepID=UPI0026072C25|nr:hypothetical protein [Mycolicibacterium fortuitum]